MRISSQNSHYEEFSASSAQFDSSENKQTNNQKQNKKQKQNSDLHCLHLRFKIKGSLDLVWLGCGA